MIDLLCNEHKLPATSVVVYRQPLPGGDFTTVEELACGDAACFDQLWRSGLNAGPDVYALDIACAEAISGLHLGVAS